MPYIRVSHGGGAVPTTLTTSITSSDATLTLDAAGGWPDGSVGPFYIVLGSGLATEEKALVTSRTGTSLVGVTRGVDGTSASSHASGETVLHVFSATEADEANVAVRGTVGNITTKGDQIVATGSGVFGRLAAGTNGLPQVADSTQTTGMKFAALTSAGIATDAVGTAQIAANAVTSDEIAPDAVGSSEIANFAVNTAKLAPLAVSTAQLDDASVTTTKIAQGTILTEDLADGQITSAKIADGTIAPADIAVGATPSIKSAAVTGGPVGSSAVVLATISIGAQPYAYTLVCAAHWSASNSVDNDTFSMSVKVDTVLKGKVQNRHTGGANSILNYAITGTTPVAIPASTACSVTVTAIQEAGSGNLSSAEPGVVTAHLFPKDPA